VVLLHVRVGRPTGVNLTIVSILAPPEAEWAILDSPVIRTGIYARAKGRELRSTFSSTMTTTSAHRDESLTEPPVVNALPEGCTLTETASTRRVRESVLVGGAPFRVINLSPKAQGAYERLISGTPLESSPSLQRFARRLVDGGLLAPRWPSTPVDISSLTVVVPVRDRFEELDALLGDLKGLSVIVVDDASKDAEGIAEIVSTHGARLVRRSEQGGPGAARNTGFAHVTTPLVLFVDSDCRLSTDQLGNLVSHFTDPMVGAAAPRIRGPKGSTWFSAYESDASPLDLGPRRARVRPGSEVGFVPTAALLVRTSIGSTLFNEQLDGGEDVDLIWRLSERGWGIAYEPSVTVEHPARPDLLSWMAQRSYYGSTAASLEHLHGDAAAPIRGSAWMMSATAAMALRRPILGAGLFGIGIRTIASRLRGAHEDPVALAADIGLTNAWRHAPLLARQILRSYAPLLVLASLASRRSRRAAALCTLTAGIGHYVSVEASMDPIQFIALSTLDDLSYCAGLWRGAARTRRSGALRPRIVWRSR